MLHLLLRTGDSDAGAPVRNARARITLPAMIAATVLAGSAPAMATPAPAPAGPTPTVQPAPTTQGIIMRDGGICDPIRHMGC